jgi:predicted metal-dependent enzyme (double-stranded beta helix superfamily)
MPLSSLPPRNLERQELERLVARLAADPEMWREHAGAPVGERRFVSLHRDDYVDIWVITWAACGDTGWHDHDISSGAVHVAEGELRECNPRLGAEAVERMIGPGQTFSFGPDHIHRLCGRAERSISIHAYSPPLWRLGQYAIDAQGVMRRLSISYADELRPLGEPLAA